MKEMLIVLLLVNTLGAIAALIFGMFTFFMWMTFSLSLDEIRSIDTNDTKVVKWFAYNLAKLSVSYLVAMNIVAVGRMLL